MSDINAMDWVQSPISAQISQYPSTPREIFGPPPGVNPAFAGILDELESKANSVIGGPFAWPPPIGGSEAEWSPFHGYVSRHRRRNRYNFASSTIGATDAMNEREIIGAAVSDIDPQLQNPHVYATVEPIGATVRGRYWRDGHFLVGLVACQLGDRHFTVKARVDLRPLVAELRRLRAEVNAGEEFGGIFDDIGRKLKKLSRKVIPKPARNLLNKIAKSKLLKKLGQGLKDVARSKLTGIAAGVTATLFPAVGLPALAAYKAADMAFAAIDKAQAVKRQVERMVATGGAAAKALLKKGSVRQKISRILKQGNSAAKLLKTTVAAARKGDPLALKEAEVLKTVAQTRKALNKVAISGVRRQRPRIHFQLRGPNGRPLPSELIAAMVNHRHRLLMHRFARVLR